MIEKELSEHMLQDLNLGPRLVATSKPRRERTTPAPTTMNMIIESLFVCLSLEVGRLSGNFDMIDTNCRT